jgi:ethanolamine ammonia-lyase large subunit
MYASTLGEVRYAFPDLKAVLPYEADEVARLILDGHNRAETAGECLCR